MALQANVKDTTLHVEDVVHTPILLPLARSEHFEESNDTDLKF